VGMNLIMMLTESDKTIPDAEQVYSSFRHVADLEYVAFKDVGAEETQLHDLTKQIRADGRKVVLEVADLSVSGQEKGLNMAMAIGVDAMISAWTTATAKSLAGASIEFWPFLGSLEGSPLRLRSTPAEVGADARQLAETGTAGAMVLMPYRQNAHSPSRLLREAADHGNAPLVVAGGVSEPEQFDELRQHNVWGVSIGGSILKDRSEQPASVLDRLGSALSMCGGSHRKK
jgi:hypothetical protein